MATAAAPKTVKALRIVSKPESFRRAGLAFTRTPSYHRLKDLTKEQIERLKAETMLDVTEVDATAEQLGSAPEADEA